MPTIGKVHTLVTFDSHLNLSMGPLAMTGTRRTRQPIQTLQGDLHIRLNRGGKAGLLMGLTNTGCKQVTMRRKRQQVQGPVTITAQRIRIRRD